MNGLLIYNIELFLRNFKIYRQLTNKQWYKIYDRELNQYFWANNLLDEYLEDRYQISKTEIYN